MVTPPEATLGCLSTVIFDMFDVTRDDGVGVTREELTTVLLESARAANAIIGTTASAPAMCVDSPLLGTHHPLP